MNMLLLLQVISVSTILYQLLTVVIPPLSGFIAGELAKFNGWVQSHGAFVAYAFGAVFAFGANALAQALNAPVPAGLSGFNGDVVASILTILAQIGFHVPRALKAARLARGHKF